MKLTSDQLKNGGIERNGATSIKWTGCFGSIATYRNKYSVSGSFEGYHDLGYYRTLTTARKVAEEFNQA